MENTNTAQDPGNTDPAREAAFQKLHAITTRIKEDALARGEVGKKASVGLIVIAYGLPEVDPTALGFAGIPMSTMFLGPSALVELQVLGEARKTRSAKATAELLMGLAEESARRDGDDLAKGG